MIHLTVIGSGTVAPSAERTAPAHWVAAPGLRLLLDCGPGTLHRAAQFEIPWSEATHVAITHFHPDHWGELPMLLFAMKYGIEPARQDPLELLGPRGIRARLTLTAGALGDWVLDPGFPLHITEVAPGSSHRLPLGAELEAFQTPHTPESLAYGVRTDDARLVYTGDTGPSPELGRWAEGCDLLLAECSLPDARAIQVHLTPTTAGELARTARAGRLVLTHFYPVFGEVDPAAEAANVFDGPVVAAHDGQQFTVGRSESC
jgi:ribonuclease BN (tRNA processing enzyme)